MKKFIAMLILALACAGMYGCSSATEVSYDSSSSQRYEGSYPTSLAGFSTLDFNGNGVDDGIFSNAEVSIVNFWATYCGPCIAEMPELQAWSQQLPENVQIIGVVCDVPNTASSTAETARGIVAQAGVTYTNLLAQGQLSTYAESLVGVPTTVLVDAAGNVVAGPIVGNDVQGYKDALQEALASVAL